MEIVYLKGVALAAALVLLGPAVSCGRRDLGVVEVHDGPLVTMRGSERFEPLLNPELLTAEQGAGQMRPKEKILGFTVGKQAIAISLRVLDDHEIVNLGLADEPESSYAATW